MNSTPASASRYVRRRLLAAGLVIGILATGVVVVQQTLDAAAASSSATPSRGAPVAPAGEPVAPAQNPGEADGIIRDDAKPTVFDDRLPAISRLDEKLLSALRAAAKRAEKDGIEFRVNGGWRSAALQERLLNDAIAQYGSREEASRWVATPEESEHVSGDAVDLGPYAALDWLAANGADYGLCQIYENEPWHYELRPDAISEGCPDMYADPPAAHGHDR